MHLSVQNENTKNLFKSFTNNGGADKVNRVTVDREMCKECEYCLNFCPKKTILAKSHTVNKKGYFAVEAVHNENCIACGICATVCPEGAITVEKDI